MVGLYDKFGKILQINRSFKRKDFYNANYIADYASEALLERLHVKLARVSVKIVHILGNQKFAQKSSNFWWAKF